MITRVPVYSERGLAVNRQRLANRQWQRRLILIGWLALALSMLVPAIVTCMNAGIPAAAHWDE
ncbi:MAG TPA: hypothetical protein VMJ66_17000 [Geobacteraceae bacterium]|nr:hypothetical protein [Geobacteraceae bacterium]